MPEPARRADYAPLAGFAAPARPRSELWRTAVGAALMTALYFMLIVAMLWIAETLFGTWAALSLASDLSGGRTPRGVLLLLYSFLLLVLAVAIPLRLLHGRGLETLLGPRDAALRDFVRVAGGLSLFAILLLPLSAMSEQAGRHLSFGVWLSWLPFALPGLVIQVAAEEMAFRGYLQQQLAARFRASAIWMGVPSALFAFAHFAPGTFGAMAWLIVFWSALFGVLASDLTARTGNLGAAIGFHFANNFSSIFLIGVFGDLDGLALWNLVVNLQDPAHLLPILAVDAVWTVAAWLLARVMLRV